MNIPSKITNKIHIFRKFVSVYCMCSLNGYLSNGIGYTVRVQYKGTSDLSDSGIGSEQSKTDTCEYYCIYAILMTSISNTDITIDGGAERCCLWAAELHIRAQRLWSRAWWLGMIKYKISLLQKKHLNTDELNKV